MYDFVPKFNIYIRPRRRYNKFHRYKYFYKLIRESFERIITKFIRKLRSKAENAPLIRHRWIYTIRPKTFDLSFLFWYIAEPPDTVFRIIT